MGIFPNNVKINEKAQTANFSDLTKHARNSMLKMPKATKTRETKTHIAQHFELI